MVVEWNREYLVLAARAVQCEVSPESCVNGDARMEYDDILSYILLYT